MKSAIFAIVIAIAAVGCGESKDKVTALEHRNLDLQWKLDKLKTAVEEAQHEIRKAEYALTSAESSFGSGDFNGGISNLYEGTTRVHRAKNILTP